MDSMHGNPGTTRGFSTHLWRHIPTDLLYGDPSYYGTGVAHVDDFHFIDSDRYTTTQVGATPTSTFAEATDEGEGGIVVADTVEAVAEEGIQVQEHPYIAPEAGNLLAFEARIKPAAIGTAGDFFLGLSETDASILLAGAVTPNSYIGFHGLATNELTFERRKDGGTAQSSSVTVGTLVADTWIRLGFLVDILGNAIPYVNGVEVEDGKLSGTTALPTEILGKSLVIISNGTTIPTIAMDMWACAKKKTYDIPTVPVTE